MVAARLGIVYYHTVTAHQPVDQRLDVHRTESHLAVADDDAGLNDVARHDLGLQAGVDYLDIHAAFRELAALKVHSLHILQDGKDDARNIKVVNAPVAVAQKCPCRTLNGADHTDRGLPLEPGVHILRQQLGIFLQHLVIVGCWNLQMCANLPVGNGIDLQRFKRRDTRLVIGVEVQLRVKRLQTKAAGVQHIVGFQISLALDLLCHVYKTDP